ncbi:hypothetical protein HZH68_000718 [Vespula germanica]|uniref:Uncharacterized protein n=2 Tax=Vespula TaxID=7451 RepID=A0A834U6A7_VESGE|nr:hypothetical protein HZH68_000718 [Vespula germanica]KAF7438384.1 hypothetical protein H0235_000775 [Vespula pensylvanica]
MYPWYRDSVAAAAAAGLGGPVGVVGSGFCSSGPGQGATTIKTESGYSDCMLALDYVQNKLFKNFYDIDTPIIIALSKQISNKQLISMFITSYTPD